MAQIDKYNIAKIVEEALLARLRPAIVERITNEMVKDFKAKIEPMVKAEADKITNISVNKMMNVLDYKEEIKVYIEWVDKNGA